MCRRSSARSTPTAWSSAFSPAWTRSGGHGGDCEPPRIGAVERRGVTGPAQPSTSSNGHGDAEAARRSVFGGGPDEASGEGPGGLLGGIFGGIKGFVGRGLPLDDRYERDLD